MNKLCTSHEQIVALVKTTILGVCCMAYAVHEQVINNAKISNEQVKKTIPGGCRVGGCRFPSLLIIMLSQPSFAGSWAWAELGK